MYGYLVTSHNMTNKANNEYSVSFLLNYSTIIPIVLSLSFICFPYKNNKI